MPAVSKKQRRFMRACSTKKGRRRVKARGKSKCPPLKVAKEFR